MMWEPLVRDHDERVDVVLEPLDSLLGCPEAPHALEAERRCDHTDGQRARVLDDLRDHRSGAGSRAAAHPCRKEHHVGVSDGLGNRLPALVGRLGSHVRVASDTLALGEDVADAHAHWHVAADKRLVVGVDDHILDAADWLPEHPCNGVGASAADPQDLDSRVTDLILIILYHWASPFCLLG